MNGIQFNVSPQMNADTISYQLPILPEKDILVLEIQSQYRMFLFHVCLQVQIHVP